LHDRMVLNRNRTTHAAHTSRAVLR
jgi:hypothetical protein